MGKQAAFSLKCSKRKAPPILHKIGREFFTMPPGTAMLVGPYYTAKAALDDLPNFQNRWKTTQRKA